MDEFLQVRMREDDKELLRRLSEFYGGSMSTTVRHLIKDKASDLGFWKPEQTSKEETKTEDEAA